MGGFSHERNVQGDSLHRYNKVRMAFILSLKLFNLLLKLHYTLKDSEVLSAPINEIGHSKEVLILYGVYKDLQQCVYMGYMGSWILSSTSIIMKS